MARIVTNSLLFLFLVLGCGWLSKEEVQAPKAPEPTPAPVSSTPAEAASDRTTSATIAANTTVSKEELRMLQARLKAAGILCRTHRWDSRAEDQVSAVSAASSMREPQRPFGNFRGGCSNSKTG